MIKSIQKAVDLVGLATCGQRVDLSARYSSLDCMELETARSVLNGSVFKLTDDSFHFVNADYSVTRDGDAYKVGLMPKVGGAAVNRKLDWLNANVAGIVLGLLDKGAGESKFSVMGLPTVVAAASGDPFTQVTD